MDTRPNAPQNIQAQQVGEPPGKGELKNRNGQGPKSLTWLGIGMLLMGTSFGINFMFSDAGTSFVYIMYILTILGAGCILKCMVDTLGF